ncbi:PP2C family protein-serine/threonine phosphatase [Pseudidiomarina insulisalsae]|uniref:PPM-type phosphatase domain-containing protein n=1 Tax=Pseudidiomarina insulisalsae TaxID=575789 RepID=A0A432YI20_9GAMM|nr:PP2C family protein-serine/threonine phosphatase [Pseudidiomarina insulisalsae]RUO60578.1 hypothetical protein CWI71_06860 [Pseudidiomarina insulisalsae]
MLQPSPPLVIDIYHDGSAFAEEVIGDLQHLKLAKRLRLKAFRDWRPDALLPHPTLLVLADFAAQLEQPLCCTEQLLILPFQLDAKKLLLWPGDSLVWPLSVPLLSKQIQLLVQRFQCAHQLRSMQESLAWHARQVEREYELVENIFQNALSRNFTDYPHIRTLLAPAAKFNGDLCLVAPGPTGSLYVMMADFTGHGLAPATGALPLSQAFFAMADRSVSVAEMVTEFNYRLHRLLPNEMFCACFLLELAANGERLTYWNGGMPPALVYDDQGAIKHRLKAQHVALGVLPTEEFDAQVSSIRTSASDRVAIYTDGVIEMLSQRHEFLGLKSLECYLQAYPQLRDFDRLIHKLEHFRGDEPLHDDMSLAILACCPTGLAPARAESEARALPFSFITELNADDLRQVDVVSAILGIIGHLPNLRYHRTTLYLLLAEVFNNALEHSLLGLDSRIKDEPEGFTYYYQLRAERLQQLSKGMIRVEVSYQPRSAHIYFTLSHNGTRWQPQSQAALAGQERSHGRGLELLRHLASPLIWHEDGRTVEFGYYLTPTRSTASTTG